MDNEKLAYYKKLLLKLKMDILNNRAIRSGDDLYIASEDLADEADLATSVINQQVSFNIRHMELNKLKAIDTALQKIESGGYGLCEECEEPISEKRLKNQPWTTLCITHAEEEERESQKFVRAS